jgi:hypothetical protein
MDAKGSSPSLPKREAAWSRLCRRAFSAADVDVSVSEGREEEEAGSDMVLMYREWKSWVPKSLAAPILKEVDGESGEVVYVAPAEVAHSIGWQKDVEPME